MVGAQSGQYRATMELSPGCGGGLDWDVTTSYNFYFTKFVSYFFLNSIFFPITSILQNLFHIFLNSIFSITSISKNLFHIYFFNSIFFL